MSSNFSSSSFLPFYIYKASFFILRTLSRPPDLHKMEIWLGAGVLQKNQKNPQIGTNHTNTTDRWNKTQKIQKYCFNILRWRIKERESVCLVCLFRSRGVLLLIITQI